ncbi:MAG: hypothetical protein ACXAC7_21805, partial [Candidatus Hodarchaeales archaeon]
MPTISRYTAVFLLFLMINVFSTTMISKEQYFNDDDMTIHAEIGEYYIYEFKDYLVNSKHSISDEITTVNGTKVNITLREGTNLKVQYIAEIENEFENHYYCQYTYDQAVLVPNLCDSFFIRQTTHNQSYWEEFIANSQNKANMTGDLIYMEWVEERSYYSESDNRTTKMEFNWKTGWVSYYFRMDYNKEGRVTDRIEIAKVDSGEMDIPELINLDIPSTTTTPAVGNIGQFNPDSQTKWTLKETVRKTRPIINQSDPCIFYPYQSDCDIVESIDPLNKQESFFQKTEISFDPYDSNNYAYWIRYNDESTEPSDHTLILEFSFD